MMMMRINKKEVICILLVLAVLTVCFAGIIANAQPRQMVRFSEDGPVYEFKGDKLVGTYYVEAN